MSATACFVTGTDTAVGKTLVTAGLLLAAARLGQSTLGIKPVAAGCELRDGQWMNDDALLLQRCSSVQLPYARINPVALKTAMAPHLAAAEEGVALSVAPLASHCRTLAGEHRGLLLAEGAGGWRVPLNASETMADLAAALGWPVVLVVGMRLGCLNHALLTAADIRAAGLALAGWVANVMDPQMRCLDENIASLERRLPAPRLGTVPWLGEQAAPEQAAEYLDAGLLAGGQRAGV